MTVSATPKPIVIEKPAPPPTDSWWTKHAAPDADWQAFSRAAANRARAIATDTIVRYTAKVLTP